MKDIICGTTLLVILLIWLRALLTCQLLWRWRLRRRVWKGCGIVADEGWLNWMTSTHHGKRSPSSALAFELWADRDMRF